MRTLVTWCCPLLLAASTACGDPEDDGPRSAIASGLPRPFEDIYVDWGAARREARFRALMGFPMRDEAALDRYIELTYDPEHPDFRQYMAVRVWMDRHAPLESGLGEVQAWLTGGGMAVERVGANRLLLEFSGTVGQFNDAFQTELRDFDRENPSAGRPPLHVYGSLTPLTAPPSIAERVTGVVTVDLPADSDALPGEAGEIVMQPPTDVAQGMTLSQIAHAYGLAELYALGFRGQGVKLGLVTGATFKFNDLQSFWRSLGITRNDPIGVQTMEPIATRYLETTLDTQWSGGLAPEAEVIAYQGPDSRNTSIVYTFNEAIARAEVSVLSSSFAHREETEAPVIHAHYNASAKMGAALGITIVVASGDSARPDVPSSSPYVTCVGGTQLRLLPSGEVDSEVAWAGSGSGPSRVFEMPAWQKGVVTDSEGKRAVSDVALNASPESSYWVYYLANWERYGGTSFAAPVFAATVAVVNSYRVANGAPVAGFLNPALYQSSAVQAAFRDIVQGETAFHAAKAGWDYPTGWGAPRAAELAVALP